MPAVSTLNLQTIAFSACAERSNQQAEWRFQGLCHMLAASNAAFHSMPLLPRWQYMTDQSKALVTRSVISVGVLLLAALLLRALVPWVLLALILWLVWQVMARR